VVGPPVGDRLAAFVGRLALGGELVAQRLGEAVADGMAGLAADNDRDHLAVAVHGVETADFLVDARALRRFRRAQHDQELGCLQRGAGARAQLPAVGLVDQPLRIKPLRLPPFVLGRLCRVGKGAAWRRAHAVRGKPLRAGSAKKIIG
jgi:hypothetical protein